MTARVVFEPKSTEELRQRFKEAIDKTGKPWKERQAMLSRLMAEDRLSLLARAKASFSEHFDTTGVFSFAGAVTKGRVLVRSGSPRSILMWSHYGDHHTGICVQFEVARDVETLMQAVRMEYVPDYPAINYAEDIKSK
jgi:DUF2971 family protein